MKKILITGANSYIGTSVEAYLNEKGSYEIVTLDMHGDSWEKHDFSYYDTVFHVAGIAHEETGRITENQKRRYYDVNTRLAVKTAAKAKKEGVRQFILMSSIIIYGESGGIGKKKVITKETLPQPASVYGNSKWLADKGVRRLRSENFKVAVIRPPMIYGRDSKGNYALLSELVKWLPVFPGIPNQRSMLYIENLCEFIRLMIENEEQGIFFPQNNAYVQTFELAKKIADIQNHRLFITLVFNTLIFQLAQYSKKLNKLAGKAFGNLTYDMSMSEYDGKDYRVCSFEESILRTEEKKWKKC